MEFVGIEHEAFYQGCVEWDGAEGDREREALFYTLGISADTRDHIRDLYDFRERGIVLEGVGRGWQTSGSRRLTILAFNLYNGYNAGFYEAGKHCPVDAVDTSPYALFDGPYLPYMMQAVMLRFGRN